MWKTAGGIVHSVIGLPPNVNVFITNASILAVYRGTSTTKSAGRLAAGRRQGPEVEVEAAGHRAPQVDEPMGRRGACRRTPQSAGGAVKVASFTVKATVDRYAGWKRAAELASVGAWASQASAPI